MSDQSLQRQVRELTARVVQLERMLAGVRSERRPRLISKQTRFDAVVSEAGGIAYGGVGEVTVYENDLPTTWKVQSWNWWMHGNRNADYNTEVVIEFKAKKNRFELASAGCSAGGIHAPLP